MNSDPVPNVSSKTPLKYEEADFEEAQVPQENFNKKLFIIGTVFFVFTLAASGLIFFLWYQIKPTSQTADKIAEVIQTESVEESSDSASEPVKDSLNRAEINFEVLNGSGVAGSAKTAADKLEDLGYKVTKTGNADKNNYAQSEVLISGDLKSKEGLILADLKTVFKIASSSGELSDSSASARLIVGRE